MSVAAEADEVRGLLGPRHDGMVHEDGLPFGDVPRGDGAPGMGKGTGEVMGSDGRKREREE